MRGDPFLLIVLVFAGAQLAWTQTTSTASNAGTTTSSTPSNGTAAGSTATSATAPGIVPSTALPGGGGPRPIFLSGTVMMDDGSPLPDNIGIQSLCGTLRRIMGRAASSGNFGFQWSSTATTTYSDASQAGRIPVTAGVSSLTGSRNGSRGLDPLANCELSADAPGYSSSKASLYDRAGQDNFDVGTIVLHRIVAGEGHSVSVLALQAPRGAKKNYDKGVSLAAANKPGEALASFGAAVTIYPEYADAWLGLGKVQWETGDKEVAAASFARAMQLDNKLVGPWQELGYLACDSSKWEDALRYLGQALRLDPMDSPVAWYFHSLANYNLGHFSEAEKSVRAELRMDRGKNPHAVFLLGLILIARQDLPGAADALRNYIASAPASTDVTVARRELSRVESRLSTSASVLPR